MDGDWASFELGYTRGADHLDNLAGSPFHFLDTQRMSSMERFLHSDGLVTYPNDGRSWYSKHPVDADYRHFEVRAMWQRPIEYPTPPWEFPRDEISATDLESTSTGSIWSQHSNETEHELAFVRRASPISDVSQYELKPDADLCRISPENASGGGANSRCIAPSAIQQYPDVESTNPDIDADAEGDSEDFSVDPTVQETANAPYFSRSTSYAPLKSASVLPAPAYDAGASSAHGASAHSYDVKDDDMEVESEHRDDDSSDFKPGKRARTRSHRPKPRASKPKSLDSPYSDVRSSSTHAKPMKVTKQSSRTSVSRPGALISNSQQNQKACNQCAHICPSITTLNKHILTAHTRPFICAFARYGCPATFGSKNEFKRHVSSQHLRPGIYRCDIGTCIPQPQAQRRKSSSSSFSKERVADIYNEFNRKDLFTQHVRRMHGPNNSATKAEKEMFEASLEQIRTRCWIKLHDPPPRSVCGFCLCPTQGRLERKFVNFEGKSGWEERMEHVGRHLEKGEKEEEEDIGLRDWMVQEGLMSFNAAEGGWKVVGTGKRKAEDDDAEGESE